MRKVLLLIAFVFTLTLPAHAKPRLTVRAFDDATEEAQAPAQAIVDMMTTELSRTGIFELLEREKFSYIYDEYELASSGMIDPSTAPKPGKIRNAEYIMTGAITMYYYDEKGAGLSISHAGIKTKRKTAYVVIDLRIFDNASSVIYSASEVGQASRRKNDLSIEYGKIFAGAYSETYGGILASAVRDCIMKHIDGIRKIHWE